MSKRIGIYAGTFDPVHAGHIAFALQAIETAKLDTIYFMPERQPRGKAGVEHFAHRVAMIKRAALPHPKFELLEQVEARFSVERTLPKLQKQFDGAELVFLFGSDVLPEMGSWPNVERFMKHCELVVGVRAEEDIYGLELLVASWLVQPKAITMFPSYAPSVSSSNIREALRRRQPSHGLLQSVSRYSDQNWLYISLS